MNSISSSLVSLPSSLQLYAVCPFLSQRDQIRFAHCCSATRNLLIGACIASDSAPKSHSSASSSSFASSSSSSSSSSPTLPSLHRSLCTSLVAAICGSIQLGRSAPLPLPPPLPCQLSAWLRGPGWRSYHAGTIEPNTAYAVFEPNWLCLTKGGVICTRQLWDRAVEEAQAHSKQHKEKGERREIGGQEASEASAMIDASNVDDDTHTQHIGSNAPVSESSIVVGSGSGFATDIPNSQAVATYSEFTQAGLSSAAAPMTDFPPLPPLREWSITSLRACLSALEELTAIAADLAHARAQCRLRLYHEDADPGNYLQPFTQPLPILLSWPIDTVTSSSMNASGIDFVAGPRRSGPVEPWEYDLWQQVPETDDSPLTREALSMRDSSFPTSVSALSGSTRGCAWPASIINGDPESGSGLPTGGHHLVELKVVAARCAVEMHVAATLTDVIRSDLFAAGNRQLHGIDWANLDQMFVGPAERESGKPSVLSDALLLRLSALFPSSTLVSFGSEHLCPWPSMLVAPLARGWAGGIMGGANTMG